LAVQGLEKPGPLVLEAEASLRLASPLSVQLFDDIIITIQILKTTLTKRLLHGILHVDDPTFL
jgi:hypothetical protein